MCQANKHDLSANIILFVVGCSETAFVKDGYRNWKKAVGKEGKFERHSQSRMHSLSQEKAIMRKTYVPINAQISAVAAENLSKRRWKEKKTGILQK